MSNRAREQFAQWQLWLEDEPEFYGLRFFAPGGGMIWRNRATRAYYLRHGFLDTPTTDWNGVKTFLGAKEIRLLNLIYKVAFQSDHAITHTFTSQATGYPPCVTETYFMAAYGNLEHGVIVTQMHCLTAPLDELLFLRPDLIQSAHRFLTY